MVSVALAAGVVITTLLIDVAEAAPSIGAVIVGLVSVGVVRVGLLASTSAPVPVEVVVPVPPRAMLSVPVVPATIGKPVALTSDDVLNSSVLEIFLVIPA